MVELDNEGLRPGNDRAKNNLTKFVNRLHCQQPFFYLSVEIAIEADLEKGSANKRGSGNVAMRIFCNTRFLQQRSVN
ncbi:MAG TPA: hypothetical protein VHU22_04890 [Xanthobacteraceae bacterium]|jgi:hypothetical protein|nr:hypothetical protein [Xanthobacteraceae bacterium]